MPTAPVLASARYLVGESRKELRSSIEGLPVEALNWRPAGDATNSLAVLATHTVYATRLWLSMAMGGPLPERDRDSEFRPPGEQKCPPPPLVPSLSWAQSKGLLKGGTRQSLAMFGNTPRNELRGSAS